jgi:hypothetical protein
MFIMNSSPIPKPPGLGQHLPPLPPMYEAHSSPLPCILWELLTPGLPEADLTQMTVVQEQRRGRLGAALLVPDHEGHQVAVRVQEERGLTEELA